MSHKKDDHSDDIFDEKLRDMMQKSKPPLPPGFQKEIEDLVDQLCEKEQEHQPRFRIRFVKAVVIPLICILVVCGSAIATVNHRQQRMEAMDQTEMEAYVKSVQGADAQADHYSRDLTAAEQQRIKLLDKEYKLYGKFPESELKKVDKKRDVLPDRLCFVHATSTFYFPDRKMTDEELLELIDFYNKREYSIYANANAMETEQFQAICKVTQEEAVQIGVDRIKDLFGVDVSGYETEVELLDNGDGAGVYYISYAGENGDGYELNIDSNNGAFYSIFVSNKEYEAQEKILIDNKFYSLIFENIRKNWLDKLLDLNQIDHIYLNYKSTEKDNTLYRGCIEFLFEMSNKQAFVVEYNVNMNKIIDITHFENIKNYTEKLEKSSKYWEEKGIVLNTDKIS